MTLHPPRRAPDDEQRLIVLYSLQALSPCTELQLLQFLFEHDLMNYFDMMFALGDLCARGQAVRSKKRAGNLYEVTDAGREALSLFGSRVPRSVKDLLEETGGIWKQKFQEEAQYLHEIRQKSRGEYELTLSVIEQEMDMMRLTLSLPNREMAGQLAAKWPKKAGEIYETIIRLLTEEDS